VAIGIAAGIIFDATVIRALLVPALMRLLGEANWWMPNWANVLLRSGANRPRRGRRRLARTFRPRGRTMRPLPEEPAAGRR
jgi:RND superfamily putative drug exporter